MCLFSNRSQMMSKCSKNKKVAHKAIAECVTDVKRKEEEKDNLALNNIIVNASEGSSRFFFVFFKACRRILYLQGG